MNTLDSVSAAITRTDRVDDSLMKMPLRSPLAARIGPDGALYVLNYDGYYTTKVPSIIRMAYSGSCFLDLVPSAAVSRKPDPGIRRTDIGFVVEGRHELRLHDLEGRLLLRMQGKGRAEYSLAELRGRLRLPGGIALLGVQTDQGTFTEKILF